MSLRASYQQARRQGGELHLLFCLGSDRYALDVQEVAAVLPLQRFKHIPEAPDWVAGLFVYRAEPIPVIDLCRLTTAKPAAQRASTRLVVVHYQSAQAQPLKLGLILEQATETLRLSANEFTPNPVQNPAAPYLSDVQQTPQGLIQRISVNQLLSDEVRALLLHRAVVESGA